ncbi:MAG: nicotinate (nicotinamide) nucleotide adenylyltransferase [Bacteroidales bacterium]
MRKIGIYPGSFNPIHIGHLAIANYIKEFSDLDEIWMLVSPHNPLKDKAELASPAERLMMLQIALDPHYGIKASDFELYLPTPNYTINTLRALREKYTETEFTLIIGGDNWEAFDKWFLSQEILNEFRIFVYPRPGQQIETCPANVQIFQAPLLEISSTMLRASLRQKQNLYYFYPKGVYEFILGNELYTAD